MNTTVVICSFGRPELLHATVTRLETQSCQPVRIVIGTFGEGGVLLETAAIPRVRIVKSPQKGTSIQRNVCIPFIETPYTLFLDDDVVLGEGYIEGMEALFDGHLDCAIASGALLADGAHTKQGLTHDQAEALLSKWTPDIVPISVISGYGCNCFTRSNLVRSLRFDENLPLYGWLEDMDFSSRARDTGNVVLNPAVCAVHLGTPSGRTSGKRFGYSQIANALYLHRKNGVPGVFPLVLIHWGKHFMSNLLSACLRIESPRADMQGRLIGNLRAFSDLIRGRIAPSRITSMED